MLTIAVFIIVIGFYGNVISEITDGLIGLLKNSWVARILILGPVILFIILCIFLSISFN
ncbi:MAG: hypothetical protein K6A72_09020 [Lachnospiraceae bacterium]|nr:hypothetical protein [Lachnospiraceae bacterium]